MTDQSNIDSLFFGTFVGNFVFITTNVNQTNRVNVPGGIMTETLPMFFEGVLMDIDDDFLYLGDGKAVSNAVKKAFVLQIELKEEKDQYTQILESIEPKDETDFN